MGENKYWDDGYMSLLKIQGTNSKGKIPSPNNMRGDKERGDKATKFQDPSTKYQDPSTKIQNPNLNFMRGDKERGDKETKFQDPSTKIQIQRSKIQVLII